jgi:anti-sigma regulatory factor (Ser/Thr protein kinase)
VSALTGTRPVYALEIQHADATSGRRARHWAAWVLEHTEAPQQTADTALLVLSELVTNAVVHAGGRLLVSLELTGAAVRLSVWDSGTTPVSAWATPGGEADERGRGLILARGLSASLRIDVDAAGTTVTALIPAGTGA